VVTVGRVGKEEGARKEEVEEEEEVLSDVRL
jgi:hypothetical protein